MVNGNYVLYGDRPSSESEIVNDHVQTRTAERKNKRKISRNANELQRTLNMAQLDNETDSVKFEKKVKEPMLLRYVPTTDVKENFVTEKFETYDLKPHEERPRRYTFQKKPKNPSDGSVNYAYSRSSSSCSSPNTNLPTISEHGEQYGTYRVHSIPNCTEIMNEYEKKMDKYFTKPKTTKGYAAKGSHPDSLFRVQPSAGGGMDKVTRVLRYLRWPLTLVAICIALAAFVYFLMPEHVDSGAVNSTYWEAVPDTSRSHGHRKASGPSHKHRTPNKKTGNTNSGTKTPEIDFYGAKDSGEGDFTSPDDSIKVTSSPEVLSTDPLYATTMNSHRVLPIKPVYPTNITPEVQYGNEKADSDDKLRTAKSIDVVSFLPVESTLKPHTVPMNNDKSVDVSQFFLAESRQTLGTGNNYDITEEKEAIESSLKTNYKAGKGHYVPAKQYREFKQYSEEEKNRPQQNGELRGIPLSNFTSGHSQLFGISIEDAEKMQSTTQSSAYNTRVSPTLPTWRDGADSTTKKYPINANYEVPQCRSTRLALCGGVLPYDLAGAPAVIGDRDTMTLFTQFSYLVARNCSGRTRQFVCALLEPECNPPPYPPKMPCYNLCRSIMDHCYDHIPEELSAIFLCKQYPSEDCVGAHAPCGPRELRCGDDSCVSRDWICDGNKDCPAGEDEAACAACGRDEFRCASGGCILQRWLCDGYADCPRGEDEVGCPPREVEEEAAGSAPAPAVRRPNRVPPPPQSTDESKELLMTSDTSSALRRNFTRRLSKSRSSNRQSPRSEEYQVVPEEEQKEVDLFDNLRKYPMAINRHPPKKREPVNASRKASTPNPELKTPTKLDKSINKLEKVLDGAALMRQAQAQEAQDSPEINSTTAEKVEEWTGDIPQIPGVSAHTSPCPPGELRCVDGRCITLAQLCDGTIDCSDHADEDNCFT